MPIRRLNPVVEIDGGNYYLAVQETTAVRTNTLGKKVASLDNIAIKSLPRSIF